MPEGDALMFDIDVFEKTTYLFSYRAYVVPSKGDVINEVDLGELKVKKVVAFPLLPDNFDVYVKKVK